MWIYPNKFILPVHSATGHPYQKPTRLSEHTMWSVTINMLLRITITELYH